MLIKTRSNRIYSYSPLTNRITTDLGKGEQDFCFKFEQSKEYDFSEIGMYTIEVTQECNLRCKYCCYSGKYKNRRHHNSLSISYENLDRCIELIYNHTSPDIPLIFVSFYGGEALLCQDKIKWLIEKLQTRFDNRTFEFSISTNGLLLKESIIDWICNTPELYLTITIDGSKATHDRNRVTAKGHGTFDIIMDNLRLFQRKYPELYKERVRFISTVKSITELIALNQFWMASDLLCNNRPQHISSIIPNFEKGEHPSINRAKFESVYDIALVHMKRGTEDILTDELQNLIKPIKRRDYKLPQSPKLLQTCLNIPNSCFISSEGELFICERFCNNFKVGNLHTGIEEKKCNEINLQYERRKNRYCSKCWAQRICRRCPIGLNFTESQFQEYCECEKMQLQLAIKYFCEILEFKHCII